METGEFLCPQSNVRCPFQDEGAGLKMLESQFSGQSAAFCRLNGLSIAERLAGAGWHRSGLLIARRLDPSRCRSSRKPAEPFACTLLTVA
jgi:hypothetical protein